MKRDIFTAHLAERMGTTKAEAKKATDAVLEEIINVLKQNDEISFIGFGKFSTKQREAREGVHPVTKEKIYIPAKRIAKFSVGKKLSEAAE
jgi:DNA-binding protein HU-beta